MKPKHIPEPWKAIDYVFGAMCTVVGLSWGAALTAMHNRSIQNAIEKDRYERDHMLTRDLAKLLLERGKPFSDNQFMSVQDLTLRSLGISQGRLDNHAFYQGTAPDAEGTVHLFDKEGLERYAGWTARVTTGRGR